MASDAKKDNKKPFKGVTIIYS